MLRDKVRFAGAVFRSCKGHCQNRRRRRQSRPPAGMGSQSVNQERNEQRVERREGAPSRGHGAVQFLSGFSPAGRIDVKLKGEFFAQFVPPLPGKGMMAEPGREFRAPLVYGVASNPIMSTAWTGIIASMPSMMLCEPGRSHHPSLRAFPPLPIRSQSGRFQRRGCMVIHPSVCGRLYSLML